MYKSFVEQKYIIQNKKCTKVLLNKNILFKIKNVQKFC